MGVGDSGKHLHLPIPSLRKKIINSSAPISKSATSGRRLLPVLPHPLQRDFICSRTFEASSFVSSQSAFPPSRLPCGSQITEAGTVGQAFLTTRDTICFLRNSLQMEQHRGQILAITSPLPDLTGMWESRGSWKWGEAGRADRRAGHKKLWFHNSVLAPRTQSSVAATALSVKTKTTGLRGVKWLVYLYNLDFFGHTLNRELG